MNAAELLGRLRDRGVSLMPDGHRLHVDGPEDALTDDLVALLAQRKADLLALLVPTPSVFEPDPRGGWREKGWARARCVFCPEPVAPRDLLACASHRAELEHR